MKHIGCYINDQVFQLRTAPNLTGAPLFYQATVMGAMTHAVRNVSNTGLALQVWIQWNCNENERWKHIGELPNWNLWRLWKQMLYGSCIVIWQSQPHCLHYHILRTCIFRTSQFVMLVAFFRTVPFLLAMCRTLCKFEAKSALEPIITMLCSLTWRSSVWPKRYANGSKLLPQVHLDSNIYLQYVTFNYTIYYWGTNE